MDVTSYLFGKKSGGGGTPSLQSKSLTITENGTTNVTADEGYDGLSGVNITADILPSDIGDYFDNTITSSNNNIYGWVRLIKKLPSTPITVTTTYWAYLFARFRGTTFPEFSNDSLKPTDISSMFVECLNITDVPLFDTSNVTNMSLTFSGCTNLVNIPLYNTSNVTDMSYTFNGCSELETIPSFNTSNVTNMGSMFSGCTSLTSVPLLNTSKVNRMDSMFNRCTKLEEIPLFDTSNVTNMSSMFNSCPKLKTIPLLDTSSVTTFGYMLNGCNSLTDASLDNILQMCINASSYNGTKKLTQFQLPRNYYPASRIQALPHYQDFIDAGWTIGY